MTFSPSKVTRIFPFPSSIELPYRKLFPISFAMVLAHCKATQFCTCTVAWLWVSGSVHSDHRQGVRWGWIRKGLSMWIREDTWGAQPSRVTRAFPSKVLGGGWRALISPVDTWSQLHPRATVTYGTNDDNNTKRNLREPCPLPIRKQWLRLVWNLAGTHCDIIGGSISPWEGLLGRQLFSVPKANIFCHTETNQLGTQSGASPQGSSPGSQLVKGSHLLKYENLSHFPRKSIMVLISGMLPGAVIDGCFPNL